ncbi:MAG: TonB-dependent receptor [Saprospiraceae bacterium]
MQKLLLTGILVVTLCFLLRAQDTSGITQRINEITISATRSPMTYKQLAQSVTSISANQIQLSGSQTIADALSKTGSITVQKSQQGGGSPVLRGLEANRVLLVVDGVRMNNIIYRGGHLQNIITVDPNILDRIDVLFGPASSVYGSDALGGVIHLITKTPSFKTKSTYNSTILSRWSSVNSEKMIHYDLEYGSKRLAGLFSVSFSDYGDLKGGRTKNPYYLLPHGQRIYSYTQENGVDVLVPNSLSPWLQTPSAYHQLDLVGKLKFKSGNSVDHLINLQYSTSSDIPRYDRLTDPDSRTTLRNAEWYYGPQKRFLGSYTADFHSSLPFKLNINYQNIEESRFNRRPGVLDLQSRIERVNVIGFDLFRQVTHKTNQWNFGLDGQYESVKSTAYLKNIISSAKAPLDTRYPSGSNHMSRIGAYATLTNELTKKINMQESIRLGFTGLSSDFGANDIFKFPFQKVSQSNFVYSANVGLNYKVDEMANLGFVVASGFRVPNVDDLAKVFESTAGTLIVPNPNLKPERSLSFEFNYKNTYPDKRSYFVASFYLTHIYDAIVTAPFKFNGMDSILYNGRQSLVLANQNNRLARIMGTSLEGEGFFSKYMSVVFSGSAALGKILKPVNSNFDHIPPISVKIGLLCTLEKAKLEFNLQYNDWKKIRNYLLNAEDNEAYATPLGTPKWLIFNCYSSFQLTKKFRLGLNLENILDTQYRIFSSGINAPGRNLSVALKLNF